MFQKTRGTWYLTKIGFGHTVGCRLPRESSSSSSSSTFYPYFEQRTGNWYSTRTQKSNSNLHFFVHTPLLPGHYYITHFHFFTREQDRCVRSSAQHLLVRHTVVRLSLAARIIVVVDLLPAFWAAHGCETGIELVLT
jgi:hypothetical protein